MQVRVADSKDFVPGKLRAFDVGGTLVDVVSVNGSLYAFDDKCTHMGCSLAKGTLNGTTVTCPCHGSQFDVTSGAVLRGPAQLPVRTHPVQVEAGTLVVAADTKV